MILLTDRLQNVSPLSLFFSSPIWVCWDTEEIECEIGLCSCLDAVITCVNLSCSFNWITAFKCCFLLCQKSCVFGPAFFPPLLFSIHGTTGRIAHLLYVLKAGVCAINSWRQDAAFYIALQQSWFSLSIRYIQHSLKLQCSEKQQGCAASDTVLFFLPTAVPQKKGKENGGRARETIDFPSNRVILVKCV